jgi:DNA-binding CsgD family transcriptional regulator
VTTEEGADVALGNLGYLAAATGLLAHADPDAAGLFPIVRADLVAADDLGTVPMVDLFRAIAAAFLAPEEESIRVTDAYLADARTRGAQWQASWAEWARAMAELRHGDPSAATSRLRTALRSQWDMGDRWGSVWCVEALAWSAAARGQHEAAALILGAASNMQHRLGVTINRLRPWAVAHAACVEQTREALGDAYDTTEGYGARMEVDDAINLALGRRNGPKADAPPPSRLQTSVLSEKQRAVAELIAEGRTDKQIASALFLSPRTIQSHVSAILRGLGFSSRTEIAKWVLEQRQ